MSETATDRVERWLTSIPELVTEVIVTTGTRTSSDEGERRRSVPASRVLIDIQRHVVLSGSPEDTSIRSLLRLADTVYEAERHFGIIDTEPPTILNPLCVWLAGRTRWVHGTAFWGEFEQTVRQLRGELRYILGLRDRKSWPCMETGCESTLTINRDNSQLWCANGHTFPDLMAWRLHGSMTTRELVAQFGVAETAIWQWRSRGFISPDPSKPKKPASYFPWDIIKMRWPELAAAVDEKIS